MKNHIFLVVLGSLLATAAVKADGGQASAGKWFTVPSLETVKNIVPSLPSLECLKNNAVVTQAQNFYNDHQRAVQVSAAVAVVGITALTVMKCSWLRKKLGLETEETRGQKEFDIEALFADQK